MGTLYNRRAQKPRRQSLRTHSTRAEVVLWMSLKARQMMGYKFRRQHGIGRYILDFYCPELRLAIEVDGTSHQSEKAALYDRLRQKTIERHGIYFLRFSDEEVLGNIDPVLEKIRKQIELKRPT